MEQLQGKENMALHSARIFSILVDGVLPSEVNEDYEARSPILWVSNLTTEL